MKEIAGQPVFTAGGEEYRWLDVLLAAHLRGDWDVLERQAARGWACERHAAEAGELPSAAEEKEAGAAFRRERDLLAADEMQDWLREWQLSIADWRAYIRRSLLRERRGDEADALLASHGPDEEQLAGLLRCEGACSGWLRREARKLARRAAARAAAAADSDSAPPEDAESPAAPSSLPNALRPQALGVSPEQIADRLALVGRDESAFRRMREQVLTSHPIEPAIEAHRMDWLRVEYRSLPCRHEDMAREAVLCVREDGASLEEVAARARVPLSTASVYVDQADPCLRDDLLCAEPGELLGPLALDEGQVVMLVDRKIPPSATEPALRERLERELLTRSIRRCLSDHVRWHGDD